MCLHLEGQPETWLADDLVRVRWLSQLNRSDVDDDSEEFAE